MVAAEAQTRNLQACMCNQTIEGILCPVPSSAGQCGVGVERLCSNIEYDTALVDLCAWHGWKLAHFHLGEYNGPDMHSACPCMHVRPLLNWHYSNTGTQRPVELQGPACTGSLNMPCWDLQFYHT